jgi:activator of HSP90 ATPase
MKNSFTLTTTLAAIPQEVYDAWLSSDGHAVMTGSPAKVEAAVGGKFSAWDGYIFGKTLELDPPRRILQTWRTTEFPKKAPDSRIEILFEAITDGTKLTLLHTDMPEDQVESYRQGWEDFYFKPTKEYFG